MRDRDLQAFEEFARARSRELLRAAWLLTGDRGRAEDLVQDCLARIYTRWPRVRSADNPVAYSRTVLTRLFLDSVRRRGASERPIPVVPDGAAHDPDSDLRGTLVTALRELGPVDRAVVVQRYLLDQDVRAVAADLGLTENAVRTRSSRSLARVREILGPDFLTMNGSQ